DTVKEALHYTAGITFQAAEGGEEDIRLRGFSLATTGDIFVDGLRDPAFYERDTFSFDRVELLRGSASMLFGRGSTGGVVNQVSKVPLLTNVSEVSFTAGSGNYLRSTGDFNIKTGETSALRINTMITDADNYGNKIDKYGLAPSLRLGIGTPDEFTFSLYALDNRNGLNYGMPWLRKYDGAAATSPANPGVLIPVSPKNYYGAASDYNASSAELATFDHVHRFAGSGRLHSSVRYGYYDRDQRSGTNRFCVRSQNAQTGVVTNPDCPTTQPSLATINGATPLVRAANGNNKVQNMRTTYAQSDYGNQFDWLSVRHDLLGGIDLAHEKFKGFNVAALPPGVVLDKNTPRVTLGNPNDGTSVDESKRIRRLASDFDAKSVGVFVQDLIQIAPAWKILAGLRWDHFEGTYRTFSTAASTAVPVIGTETASRSRTDSPWSKRAGLIYQPTDYASFHFSYGTSFNTSGDTYQYDNQTVNTPPESSQNLELGAKLDLLDGRLSTRVAAFRSTKLNERNRDPDSAAEQNLLSGKRHSAGIELDLAGRITPNWEVYGSYAWTPIAKIDIGAPGSTPGVGEGEGTRSALTPRHSGTIWSTYQLTPELRLGAGVNARSSQTPNRNPAGIVAPRFVTADLLAEYAFNPMVALKLNLINVANKLYADSLYTGHYIPGQARTVYATLTARF
ncbi:MAG: TonB-dependent receptor, partial [Caldimonas sp.]